MFWKDQDVLHSLSIAVKVYQVVQLPKLILGNLSHNKQKDIISLDWHWQCCDTDSMTQAGNAAHAKGFPGFY